MPTNSPLSHKIVQIIVSSKKPLTQQEFRKHIRSTPAHYQHPYGLTVQENLNRINKIKKQNNQKCIHLRSRRNSKEQIKLKDWKQLNYKFESKFQDGNLFSQGLSKQVEKGQVNIDIFSCMNVVFQDESNIQKQFWFVKDEGYAFQMEGNCNMNVDCR